MADGNSEIPDYARGYEGFEGRVGRTSSQSTPWWKPEPSAPAGAPNIVVVLIDDMGYSDISPFGAEIDTPNIAALAERGFSTVELPHDAGLFAGSGCSADGAQSAPRRLRQCGELRSGLPRSTSRTRRRCALASGDIARERLCDVCGR